MKPILQQAWRAATLDRRIFGEWLYSHSATGDAALVVIGVTFVRYLAIVLFAGLSALSVTGLIRVVLDGLVGWIFLAVATWFAGTRLFGGSGDWQGVLRLQGLAYLPNVLGALGVLSGPVGTYAPIIGFLWYIVASVIATEVALSLDRRNAILSVAIGAALVILVESLIGATFTGIGAVFGAFN